MNHLLALLALAFSCAVAAAGQKRDLILVAGQSNAVGFDAKAKELPADAVDKQILFWWRCGDPPPDEFDCASRGWTTLQAQPRANPKPGPKAKAQRQYGNFANADGGFGPEMGFARTLFTRENKPFAVVKAAFSGTDITKDWNPRGEGEAGACYRALVSETKAAMAKAAEKGVDLQIRALVWVQGESDANAKSAPEYGKNLGGMLTALQKELNAPQMIALVGVNTNFGGGKNAFMPVIVEQQKALAGHLPRCAYVDTSGLTYANNAHFDTKATIEVGRRFADALLKLEEDLKKASGAAPRN